MAAPKLKFRHQNHAHVCSGDGGRAEGKGGRERAHAPSSSVLYQSSQYKSHRAAFVLRQMPVHIGHRAMLSFRGLGIAVTALLLALSGSHTVSA